jgi:hypothetical protein
MLAASSLRLPEQPVVPEPSNKTINGFFAVFVLFGWGFLYLWLMARGFHHLLGLNRFTGRLEVASYALHLVPVLAVPILIFRLARRREAARDPGQVQAAGTDAKAAVPKAPPAPDQDKFEQLQMKTFASPLGVVLKAPETWFEGGDEKVFQVVDPKTGTQFSASASVDPGVTLEEWTRLRLQAVKAAMPYLRRTRAPYPMSTANWQGLVGEYEGLFPGGIENKHYLVLCLIADGNTYSITITAVQQVYEQRERFYKWLLQNNLDIHKVERV